MKKYFLILSFILSCVFSSCGPDSGSTTTRAGIIAEDMARNELLSSSDMDWSLVGVDETGTDSYHVVANIKALNGLGMKVPRKVSVRLRYNGAGDWAGVNNGTKESIKYLDESTGRQY